jgi:hypothetical protein
VAQQVLQERLALLEQESKDQLDPLVQMDQVFKAQQDQQVLQEVRDQQVLQAQQVPQE